jgi:hypothetical protein
MRKDRFSMSVRCPHQVKQGDVNGLARAGRPRHF